MRRRRLWWTIGILAILASPIAWYLGAPLILNRTVDEESPSLTGPAGGQFPLSTGAVIPAGMTLEQVEAVMVKAANLTIVAAEAMPAETTQATAVLRGRFSGTDAFHRGEGTATVYRVGQDLILRFEAFKVTNGPDLRVILTKHAAPRSRADVQVGYVEIARLKGNVGNQNYTLVRSIRLADFRAAVIYCKAFHVPFATAPLNAAQ